MRDPRDITVSWYFSSKCSHVAVGDIPRIRKDLKKLSRRDGLIYTIHHLNDFGLYAALGSWPDGVETDHDVMLVRYEDLVAAHNFEVFKKLFSHLDIRMPDRVLADLINAYSFKRLSGRKRGRENRQSHLRKGKSGDWRNHFDDEIEREFQKVTGDLVERAGYA
jgi:hypothetical protein